jgi:TIGR02453 family protein
MATAASTFAGFTPAAIQFLADLAQNNDRAWFQPRKGEFERLLKEPMAAMIAALGERLAARGVPMLADPDRSPFRIYRDTRFSKDKSPYKTHLGATFPWVEAAPGAEAGGSHDERAHGNGGYFHFEPGEMYAGGGMWRMEKPRLDAFRVAVRDDPDRVRASLETPSFVAWFGDAHGHEELKRVPPGYPQEHPLAHMFRWKDVVFGRRLADEEVLSPDLPDRLAEGYATAAPVFRFLAGLE